ncbi:MAG: hypothetical protein HKO64_11030, partial [Xanthomonadales bacterium]|nr:hypothetical protein [Gammaproteobacteria bacterium]NNL96144.1 hypothetical protein [Xanthomonadales bacterium]
MPKFTYYPYYGPNRRSDRRMVEVLVDFDPDERVPEAVEKRAIRALRDVLPGSADALFPAKDAPRDAMVRLGWYLARTALYLQRAAGHLVEQVEAFSDPGGSRCIALVEHEDSVTGTAAVKLAIDHFSGLVNMDGPAIDAFLSLARGRALPRETVAVIDVLRRLDIPFFQPEREPLHGNMRMRAMARPNGLLLIGHGSRTELIDGTFCTDRADARLKALLRNPGQRQRVIQQLGLPQQRAGGTGTDAQRQYDLLLIGQTVRTMAAGSQGNRDMIKDIHPSIEDLARQLSKGVGNLPVAVRISAANCSMPLESAEATVLD